MTPLPQFALCCGNSTLTAPATAFVCVTAMQCSRSARLNARPGVAGHTVSNPKLAIVVSPHTDSALESRARACASPASVLASPVVTAPMRHAAAPSCPLRFKERHRCMVLNAAATNFVLPFASACSHGASAANTGVATANASAARIRVGVELIMIAPSMIRRSPDVPRVADEGTRR
jgi:hypothetical protein